MIFLFDRTISKKSKLEGLEASEVLVAFFKYPAGPVPLSLKSSTPAFATACEDMLAWSKSWRWLCSECKMFRAVKSGGFSLATF